MASFDGGAFDPLAFDAAAFDLEDTPGALYGSATGSGTAGATLTAIAWIAGSAAGTSTAQAYLELDAPPDEGAQAVPMPDFSSPGSGRRWVDRQRRRRRRHDEELMLAGLV